MSCGLSARLYALDNDKAGLAPSASIAPGLVMVTSEKAAVVGPGAGS
jgi:hypothetical protein